MDFNDLIVRGSVASTQEVKDGLDIEISCPKGILTFFASKDLLGDSVLLAGDEVAATLALKPWRGGYRFLAAQVFLSAGRAKASAESMDGVLESSSLMGSNDVGMVDAPADSPVVDPTVAVASPAEAASSSAELNEALDEGHHTVLDGVEWNTPEDLDRPNFSLGDQQATNQSQPVVMPRATASVASGRDGKPEWAGNKGKLSTPQSVTKVVDSAVMQVPGIRKQAERPRF